MQTDVILRLPKVTEVTGLPRSSIYDAIHRGEFPRPLKLGARASGWRMSEVQQWIARQTARRDGEAA